MSDVKERKENEVQRGDDGLVVDADYLKAQASEALTTFLTPLLGVVGAATGKRVKLYKRSRRKKAA